MDKWTAMRMILEADAEAFAEQANSFSVKAGLLLDPAEKEKHQAIASMLAFQVAAATHYAEVMNDLDKQEEMARESGAEPTPAN